MYFWPVLDPAGAIGIGSLVPGLNQSRPYLVTGYGRHWVRLWQSRVRAVAAWPETGLAMPGIDRLRDGPDAVSGMERSESAVAGRDRGVLAEAGTRRECALAYRATVEAVYAETGRLTGSSRAGVGKATESATASRSDMAERYPDQYVRPGPGRRAQARRADELLMNRRPTLVMGLVSESW